MNITAPPPSPWVTRFADMAPSACTVLDLAAGSGRHTSWFLNAGHSVVAIDRDISWLKNLEGQKNLAVLAANLETAQLPINTSRTQFGCVVVTNYLHRPLLSSIVGAVAEGGVLLYETFAQGNERFGHPRNPLYLLAPGELLAAVAGELTVTAYEHGEVARDGSSAVVQRIAAVRSRSPKLLPS